jgi:drug/metabolite transporter (DMT)-like permease
MRRCFASRGNLTSLSALTFLTPIFALIFGSLFLDETLTILQFGGVAVTLVSILAINQREALDRFFSGSVIEDVVETSIAPEE